MTHKDRLLHALIAAIFAALISAIFWIGINKELCNRDYPAHVYKEMKLEC